MVAASWLMTGNLRESDFSRASISELSTEDSWLWGGVGVGSQTSCHPFGPAHATLGCLGEVSGGGRDVP